MRKVHDSDVITGAVYITDPNLSDLDAIVGNHVEIADTYGSRMGILQQCGPQRYRIQPTESMAVSFSVNCVFSIYTTGNTVIIRLH